MDVVRHSICSWQRPPTTRPTTSHVCKTRGCYCSFRLLMMGGVSPETCRASYKYEIIKFWYIVASCWIFPYKRRGSLVSCNGCSEHVKIVFCNSASLLHIMEGWFLQPRLHHVVVGTSKTQIFWEKKNLRLHHSINTRSSWDDVIR